MGPGTLARRHRGMTDIGEIMLSTSDAVLSGLFGNHGAIYGVLIVLGVLIVATFVVGWLVIVLRNIDREWPVRRR